MPIFHPLHHLPRLLPRQHIFIPPTLRLKLAARTNIVLRVVVVVRVGVLRVGHRLRDLVPVVHLGRHLLRAAVAEEEAGAHAEQGEQRRRDADADADLGGLAEAGVAGGGGGCFGSGGRVGGGGGGGRGIGGGCGRSGGSAG